MSHPSRRDPWFVRFGAAFEVGCGVILLLGLGALILVFFAALGKYP